MMGSVKSMMTSTEPPYGTLTVSSHRGSAMGLSFFRVRKEMDLMDVHGMEFLGRVYNFPVLICSHLCVHHRFGIERKLVSIDIKTLPVFRKCHCKSRGRFLFRSEI